MTMTIHLDCYATTDCKPECYQVLKPEIEFHMMNKFTRHCDMCTHIQKRRHFYAKTTNANMEVIEVYPLEHNTKALAERCHTQD